MEKLWNHMTERILDLTLEIIYLLTGEDYEVVKKTSGEPLILHSRPQGTSPMVVPSPHSPTRPVISSEQKILEVTKKIINLLAGEEWEYLEGHTDIMMEDRQTLKYDALRKNTFSLNELILDLTLEIIYLLTGEACAVVLKTSLENITESKSPPLSTRTRERQSPTTMPPPPTFMSLERKREKILEATQKIVELLTGEVPIRCQDVTANLSMKEPAYLEGHKDSTREHQEIPHHDQPEEQMNIIAEADEEEAACVNENHQTAEKDEMTMNIQQDESSPDNNTNVSRKRNPPETCPRPLDSRDSTQEDLSISHKGINPSNCDNAAKEEIEEGEEVGVMEERTEGHKHHGVMIEPFNDTNPSERCPHPLDSTHEDLPIPHHDQDEEQMCIKVEIKEEEEETYVGGDEPSMEEVGVMMKCEEDDIFLPVDTTDGCDVRNTSERRLLSPADCTSEDNVITQDSPSVNPDTQNIHHRPYCSETSMVPFDQGECSDQSQTMVGNIHTGSCTVDRSQESSSPHEGDHRSARLFSCSLCTKSFIENKNVIKQQGSHAGERRYLCLECKKCLTEKGSLTQYQRTQIGEAAFPCPDCGKCFINKAKLIVHRKTHTGERPFSCLQCNK